MNEIKEYFYGVILLIVLYYRDLKAWFKKMWMKLKTIWFYIKFGIILVLLIIGHFITYPFIWIHKKFSNMKKILLITIIALLSIGACNSEKIEPVDPLDPCSVYPDPPYGDPDHVSTWESPETEYKAIIYLYDCYQGEYITVSYHINSSLECWEVNEERAEGICD